MNRQTKLKHRWIYSIFVSIDANFRLKQKDRKGRVDESLGEGWGYVVPQKPYKEQLDNPVHTRNTQVS